MHQPPCFSFIDLLLPLLLPIALISQTAVLMPRKLSQLLSLPVSSLVLHCQHPPWQFYRSPSAYRFFLSFASFVSVSQIYNSYFKQFQHHQHETTTILSASNYTTTLHDIRMWSGSPALSTAAGRNGASLGQSPASRTGRWHDGYFSQLTPETDSLLLTFFKSGKRLENQLWSTAHWTNTQTRLSWTQTDTALHFHPSLMWLA